MIFSHQVSFCIYVILFAIDYRLKTLRSLLKPIYEIKLLMAACAERDLVWKKLCPELFFVTGQNERYFGEAILTECIDQLNRFSMIFLLKKNRKFQPQVRIW